MPATSAPRNPGSVHPSEVPERAARRATAVPDLSIVVVNRNTRGLLDACLASIRSSPDTVGLEVIVVDNGSTDGSVELVREGYPEVRLIANPRNTGYAFPNNQGIAESRGRYVLLLNSDTEVRPLALTRMVEFMDSHPEAGACGPLLRFPDGRLQRSCYSVPSPRTYLSTVLTLDRRFPRSRWFGNQHTGFGHDRTSEAEAILGAALLVRRETLEAVGGLDERLRIHYNDFDWCLRIRAAGWKVFFVHDAEVVHHLQATTRAENRHLELQPELVRNLFDFFRKHYGAAGVRWVRLGMLVGWGGRWLAFGALDRLRGRGGDPVAARYRLGLARAGLTGRPEASGGGSNTAEGEASE